MKKANSINIDTVREYFLDDPFKVQKKFHKKAENKEIQPLPIPSSVQKATVTEFTGDNVQGTKMVHVISQSR